MSSNYSFLGFLVVPSFHFYDPITLINSPFEPLHVVSWAIVMIILDFFCFDKNSNKIYIVRPCRFIADNYYFSRSAVFSPHTTGPTDVLNWQSPSSSSNQRVQQDKYGGPPISADIPRQIGSTPQWPQRVNPLQVYSQRRPGALVQPFLVLAPDDRWSPESPRTLSMQPPQPPVSPTSTAPPLDPAMSTAAALVDEQLSSSRSSSEFYTAVVLAWFFAPNL